MKTLFHTLIACLCFLQGLSQLSNVPSITSGRDRLAGLEKRKSLQESSLLTNIPFRSIGPSIMSGRVVDFAVNPDDPSHFYVAYASGGLWVTKNNGQSFTPLFDREAVMTIGAIAVDWKHHQAIWVGTGENNSSRSSYAGTGIYKSEDQGITWQHKGLEESHHIGKIILHPDDSDMVWVAALGHLYSANNERGVYETTDGGKTWRSCLFVHENTGAVDMAVDPGNPDVIYAAFWQRERRAWNFEEAGPNSGIYKSTDKGKNWKLITGDGSGFPQDSGTGRIGITLFPGNSNLLYACLDNQNHRPEKDKKGESKKLTAEKLEKMNREEFLMLDNDLLDEFLTENDFPDKYPASQVKQQVKKGQIKPSDLAAYTHDANSSLFRTPVTGQELYRSDDGGHSWHKTHTGYLDDFVYTYGYYFGHVWVSPADPQKIYMAGVPMLASEDGGKNFHTIDGDNTHGDCHALWINPKRPGHLIMGDDGGVHISYDDGIHWLPANTPPVGQFYAVACDMDKPYQVYGGLQDNGVWTGPSTYRSGNRWLREGHYPYKRILGGDGMQVAVDTRDNNTVYAGFQFGNYFRINRITGESESIKPKNNIGEDPFRFNWQTPVTLSRFNQDIVYLGANKLFRSFNKGKDFKAISPDLTAGGKKGDVAFGTLTCLAESPLTFGLLYTGSDDGLVHVTRDGGNTWKNISFGLPGSLWVSRVVPSAFLEGRIYVSLNGYRRDDFNAYLFRSDDFGQTWTRIGQNLPPEPINVIAEDPVNEALLFAGTDHGLYASLDAGIHFMGMQTNLPSVPVHDLCIQPREHDLVAGTHGRSLYVANISLVEKLTDSILDKPVYAFELPSVKISNDWGKRPNAWEQPYSPQTELYYYVKKPGTTIIQVKSHTGIVLKEIRDTSERGINKAVYDMTMDPAVVSGFERERMKEMKGGTGKPALEKAENDRYYLPAGWYDIAISTEQGISLVLKLEVQSPEKRNRRSGRSVPGDEKE